MDLATFRSQLAPYWSPVNIAIIVVLFLLDWYLLAIAMVAYVVWGQKAGLNLVRPQSFVTGGARLGRVITKALSDMNNSDDNAPADTGLGSGRPDPFTASGNRSGSAGGRDSEQFEQWRQRETDRLRVEREALDAEKSAFAKEKSAWESSK